MFHDDSPVVAHAGDGNFHTIILFDPINDEHRREAERLNHFMVRTALKMEGIHTVLKHIQEFLFIWIMNESGFYRMIFLFIYSFPPPLLVISGSCFHYVYSLRVMNNQCFQFQVLVYFEV